MKILGYNEDRILLNNNIVTNIGDYRQIEYVSSLYKSNTIIQSKFIGFIECPKIRDYDTIGIFVKPQYVYYQDKWYKLVNYQSPKSKYFLYPHLLLLPDDFHSVKNIDNIPETDLKLDLTP